jgi:glycine/D-amino acid oxidase-like deaminating enzyme
MNMNAAVDRSETRLEPYWRDTVDAWVSGEHQPPASSDVVIVGAGYTGLCAALQLLRAGRSVTLLEAERLGYGCSSRNGGQVSRSIKGDVQSWTARFGKKAAAGLTQDSDAALRFIADFVASEGIECDFKPVGRFIGANSRRAFERQKVTVAANADKGYVLVDPRDVESEIGSRRFHGGMVDPSVCAINPAQYHAGLLKAVKAAGGVIVENCRALGTARTGTGDFLTKTPKGDVRSGQVLVATNGYTGPEYPFLRRRIIPIASHVVATEPLDAGLAKSLLPRNRMAGDTREVVTYFRLSPDQRRLIYGTRISIGESSPQVTTPGLLAAILDIYPQLKGVHITHSWHGSVGFTFDRLPHLGKTDGIHYCMGYCGSGISLATYYGTKVGLQMLDSAEAATALDALAFPSRFYYRQSPWFMPLALAYYRAKDRLS